MVSVNRLDGELMVDNRCSGEPSPHLPELGVYFTVPTLGCRHCGGVWVKNPNRVRPREYCPVCNVYICDGCKARTLQPGYVHRTIDELTEMVMSGRYTIAGGTVCDPILIPTGAK
jgi:hypothetical protein